MLVALTRKIWRLMKMKISCREFGLKLMVSMMLLPLLILPFAISAVYASSNTWISMANTPEPLWYEVGTVWTGGNYIYMSAGETDNMFYRYSISGNSWTYMANIPTSAPQSGQDLVWTGGDYIYKLNGYTGGYIGGGDWDFWRYSISGNSWTQMKKLSEDPYHSALAWAGGDYIYAIGFSTSNHFFRYSISGNSWTAMANLPFAAGGGCSMAWNSGNYIYALQGGQGSGFWRYDLSKNSWSAMANVPSSIWWAGSLAYDGSKYFYAWGGFNGVSDTNGFWRYHIASNSWETLANTPNPVEGGGLCNANGYFYGVRGASSETNLHNNFWRYEPPETGYSVTIWGWDYIHGWQSVPITMDGVATGYTTPHTFTTLTGTHTFAVPSTDTAGHPFSDWSTGWTDKTITVSSAGIYTARYRAGYSATIWAWDYIQGWIPEPITMDGIATGYSTPHIFSGLTGTHTFTLPSTDTAGHPFSDWSTGWTDKTITVSSAGVYTGRYRAGYSATIWSWCAVDAWLALPITEDGVATGYTTPHIFTGLTGTHTFKVPSTDANGHPFYQWSTGSTSTTLTITSAGVYTARYEPKPTVTSFTISPNPFSPNGDGTKDNTTIKATFSSTTNWNLQVKTSSSTTLRTWTGTGSSLSIIWDGKNSTGYRVPDGTYTVSLSGKDLQGVAFTTKAGTVTVDTKPPSVTAVSVYPTSFKPSSAQTTKINYTLSESCYATIGIYNSTGALKRTLLSTVLQSSGFHSVIWNGKDSSNLNVSPGTYTVKIYIIDLAGNRAATYPIIKTVTVV